MGDIILRHPVRSSPRERPRILRVFWDTGALRTLVKASIAGSMKSRAPLPEPVIFHGLGNGGFPADAIVHLYVRLMNQWCPHPAYVVADSVLDDTYNILMGHDFMQGYDVRLRPKTRSIHVDRSALKMAMRVR